VSWLFSLLVAANYQPGVASRPQKSLDPGSVEVQKQRRRWLILAVVPAILYWLNASQTDIRALPATAQYHINTKIANTNRQTVYLVFESQY
jgi:hypothetical protein